MICMTMKWVLPRLQLAYRLQTEYLRRRGDHNIIERTSPPKIVDMGLMVVIRP